MLFRGHEGAAMVGRKEFCMYVSMHSGTASQNDKYISQAVCFQVTAVGIKNMLVQAVPFLYARNSLLNLMILFAVMLFYIRTLLHIKKISMRVCYFLFFLMISFAWTFAVFPENSPYIIRILPRTVPYCFLIWMFLAELKSFYWLEYYMNRCMLAVLFFSMVSAMFIYRIGHITMSDWSSYSMPLSYVTMWAVMWLLYRFFKEEKIRWMLLAFIGIAIIILYGSRNPLLAIAAYLIVMVLKKTWKDKSVKRIKYLFLTVLGCGGMLFWKECLALLGNVLSLFSISSRTISLLSTGKIDPNGRDIIHQELTAALNQHPILGFGICGDEVVLQEMSQSAHSLYLSILSNYGYFIGAVFLGLLVYWNYRAYQKAQGLEKDILLIYMCMVWPRGFTGGDIWTSDVFWWMLGLIISLRSPLWRCEERKGSRYDSCAARY